MSDSKKKHYTRVELAWEIVCWQLLLLFTVVLLRLGNGFDEEQLTSLTAILAPFTGLYLGVAMQEFANDRSGIIAVPNGQKIRWMVIVMFGSAELLILVCGAAPLYLSFTELTAILTVIQALFGAQMGNLLKKIFADNGVDKKE